MMGKIDLHVFKIAKEGCIYCIGDKDNISKLKEFKHKYNIDNVINFLVENKIYCGLVCSDDSGDILSEDNMWKLSDNGLLVDYGLVVEALILCNIKQTYDNIEEFEMNFEMSKKDIDDVVNNSWWVDKFEV